MISFSERVYQIVRLIHKGRVATYSQVAVAAGRPLAARAVGNALHQNPYPNVPCHRVVNAQGRLAPNFGKGGYKQQKKLLLMEGIIFNSSKKVNLKGCRYHYLLK
ncbi:MGMT family protein [Patescibacteria group bacterium]